MKDQIKGWSFYFTYGPSGGFRIENGKRIKRLVLWRIGFGWMNRDIEMFMEDAFKIANEYKDLLKETKGIDLD